MTDHDPLNPETSQPNDPSEEKVTPSDAPVETEAAVLPDIDTAILRPPQADNLPGAIPATSDEDTRREPAVEVNAAIETESLAKDEVQIAEDEESDAIDLEFEQSQWREYAPLPVEVSREKSSYEDYTPPADPDIDAALAAVASLGTLETLEQGAETEDDVFSAVQGESERRDVTPAIRDSYTPSLAVPPLSKLKRGSLASVIPALALIGLGAWLTFVTTSGGTVEPLIVLGVLIVTGFLSLFAYWISTGRWSRGALFAAALILLIAAVVVVSVPLPVLNLNFAFDLSQAFPLILAAVGIAMLLGGILSRPRTQAAFAPGIVLLFAGIIGFLVTLGIIPQSILNFAAPLWFIPLVILVILWLLPLVVRMRGRE